MTSGSSSGASSGRDGHGPYTSAPPRATPTRSQPWWTDGTIVIRAQDTIFRVYRGILETKSPRFAREIGNLATERNPEFYDSCPVVCVPESADEMRIFLPALHDPDFYDQYTPTLFSTVVAILRLAHIYQVPSLKDRALHQLAVRYPTTLAEYDRTRTGGVPHLITGTTSLATLVKVARETGVRAILPAVFYAYAAAGTEKIVDGSLSAEDKRVCILGGEKLKARKLAVFAQALWTQKAGRKRCTRGCTRKLTSAALSAPDFLAKGAQLALDPTPTVEQLEEAGVLKTCACMEMLRNALTAERKAAWEALPGIFGLPGWQELGKMK